MLTYGNYGGKHNNGGIREDDPAEINWECKPVDGMDRLFRAHKLAFSAGVTTRFADCQLVNALMDTTVKGVYANLYKCGVVVYYGIRVYFMH